MKLRLTLVPAAAVAAALLLSACASTQIPGSAVVPPTVATTSTATSGSTPAAAAPTIALGDAGAFGKVLTGDKGLTLYGFTDDKDGLPTCVGACANAWPAVLVTGAFTAPAGFDASLFTVVDRPDGTKQLKIGKWPLYFYSGDEKAGDINGQGSGGKWFVLDGKGALLKEAPAPAATTAPAAPSVNAAQVGSFGKVLVAANGNTLYGFTDDTNGTPTCVSDACKKTWPALTADAGAIAAAGLDQAQLTTVDRPDGGKQLKFGKWPLYFYSGDGKAGEANGQGIGGKWFVIATDGKLVKPGEATPTTPAASGPVVSLANVGKLGQVMVGANGHTLYAFTTDTKTKTTCVDACAAAWPPLTVEPGFTVSPDLAKNGVTTLTRPDGKLQLVMGDWPLYFYAGDGKAGEAIGQGVGGKWFAINAQCKLVKTAA